MTMFKPGEKYETRGGSERKVVWIGERYLIVIDEQEFPGQRYLDGRIHRDSDSSGDLMSRTKEVTRYVPASTQWGFETEDLCREVYPDCPVVPITFPIPDDGGSEE